MTTKPKWSDIVSRDSSRALAAANGLLPAWVSLAIVILIGWQLAKIIWMFIPGTEAGRHVDVPAIEAHALQSKQSGDVESIAAVHMFGQSDAAATNAVPLETEALPDTNIGSLVLKATYTAQLPELSVAIIADGRNDEKVYAIGAPVASGATLHAVHLDRVVLNEQGELTNLSLPREFTESNAISLRRSQPTRQSNVSNRSIQAAVAQNVSRLADAIRPTPFFQNGQQQGYRVYPGRNRRQFSALGLRPGDLIKQIDGQSLTDPTQAMQIFQTLGTASQVSVTVERNGTQQTLVLRTDQLEFGKDQTE